MGNSTSKQGSGESQPTPNSSVLSSWKAFVVAGIAAAAGIIIYKFAGKPSGSSGKSGASTLNRGGDGQQQQQQQREDGEEKGRTLVRVDSELEIPETPTGSEMLLLANPFGGKEDENEENWNTFSLTDAGITFKYPPKLEPKQVQNLVLFGKIKSLVMIIVEKSNTREELRRMIQTTTQQLTNTATEILSENKFTIGSSHEAYEYDLMTGGQKSWTCAIIDSTRTLMLTFDLANSEKSGLAMVKKMASTIVLSEPKVIGSLKVRAKKQPLEMPLPSVHYMLQLDQDDSDESTIFHARDVRKRHMVTTGIRIKRRLAKRDKTMSLEEFVQKRLEDLAEYAPKQSALPNDIDGVSATVLAYQKAIKQQHYDMVEVLFVRDQIGYICQVYELQGIAGSFVRVGLECITQLRFLEPTAVTQDTFVYEQPERMISVEIPARLQCIREHPLSDEMLVEFVHDTGDTPDVEYTTFIIKKVVNRKLIGDLDTLKEHIRADIAQQNKMFREILGNPQIASQFGDFITLQTCEVINNDNRPAVKMVARGYNPSNMDQQKTHSTYLLVGEGLYTLQTVTSERIFTEATRKEIEEMHSTFLVKQ